MNKFLLLISTLVFLSIIITGCQKTIDITTKTIIEDQEGNQIIKVEADMQATTDCGDIECFEENFKACKPSFIDSTLLEGLTYHYEIIGPKEDKCEIEALFLENPNPDIVGKKMRCLLDNSVNFVLASQDLEPCEGELKDILMGDSIQQGCLRNSDCTNNLYCIDSECKTLADINTNICESKCSLTDATITTSDGDVLTLRRGQGSYSFAGSVEWKIGVMPPFCPSEDVKVPIVTIKKQAGEILEEQVLSLKKGQTSELITHPNIKRVDLKLTLDNFTQSCE